jgi:hypothetical protein
MESASKSNARLRDKIFNPGQLAGLKFQPRGWTQPWVENFVM